MKQPTKELLEEALECVQETWCTGKQKELDDDRTQMYWDEDAVPQEDTAHKGRRRRIQPERMTANELRREVDLIASLFPYPSEIGVQYVGQGTKSESVAEMVELGVNEAIDQLNPSLDSPLLRERWSMCLYGRAARLIVPGDLYWWDFPYMASDERLDDWAKRHSEWVNRAPIPVCWVDLPAESTFPTSFGRMKEEVVSWQKVTKADLEVMFSAGELSMERELAGEEQFLVIYSNCGWLTYALTSDVSARPTTVDKILRSEEHQLGVPAIQILPGATSGRKEPGRFWQGVSDGSIALIKAANRRLSEAATASKFDALPIFKMWLQEENLLDEGSSSDRSDMFQGDLWSFRTANQAEGLEKEDVEALFNPQFGEKTLALAQFALQRAERNSGALEALEGVSGPSGEAAWSRNSIIEQAKMKHSRLSQAVSASDLAAAEQISRCIQAFGEDVHLTPMYGKGPRIVLKPDELANFRMVLKSEYKMKLPVSRRADIQLGVSTMQQCKEAGLPISPAWIMENVMDIAHPMEEFKRSVTWDLLMSDESKAYYRKLLQQESEMDLAEEEGMEIQELMDLVQKGIIPLEVAQQFAALATGQQVPGAPTGGGAGGGTSRKTARAGIPFSTNPTGPQPEQTMPASSGGY